MALTTLSPELAELYLSKTGIDRVLFTSARRFGKTRALGELNNRVARTKPDFIIFDELGSWDVPIKPKHVSVFECCDPRFPGADVVVIEKKFDRHDPRNPNPGAPASRLFFITVAGRISVKPYPAVQLARADAELIHRTLVAKLLEEERRHNPNFGRFA